MPRLEFHRKVAAVWLSHKQTELQSGAPRIALDLRRLHQLLFDILEHAICLCQRSPGRRPVIQHKRTLVEFREKFRTERAIQQIRTKQYAGDDYDHNPAVIERMR